jgi:hypothetical protein
MKTTGLFVLFFPLIVLSSYAGNYKVNSYEDIFAKALISIDIMTPGFFSPTVVEQLLSKHQDGIVIRTLMDNTFMDSPSNLPDKLHGSVRLRILPQERKISNTFIIIDDNQVCLGGNHFDNPDDSLHLPLCLTSKDYVKEVKSNFTQLWKQCPQGATNRQIKEFSNLIDDSTTVSESVNKHSTKTTQPPKTRYAASIRGKVYYRENSPGVKRIKPQNIIYFETENEARATGRNRARNF